MIVLFIIVTNHNINRTQILGLNKIPYNIRRSIVGKLCGYYTATFPPSIKEVVATGLKIIQKNCLGTPITRWNDLPIIPEAK